jgi:hypothetical protein
MENRLRTVQARCLRLIAGAYRATLAEALEVETFAEPLDLYNNKMAAQAPVRHHLSTSSGGTAQRCQLIRERGGTRTGSSRQVSQQNLTLQQQLLERVHVKLGHVQIRFEVDDLKSEEDSAQEQGTETTSLSGHRDHTPNIMAAALVLKRQRTTHLWPDCISLAARFVHLTRLLAPPRDVEM